MLEALAFAPAVALSPLSIIAVALLLSTRRARANAFAFLGAWVVGLAGTGAAVLLIAPEEDEPSGLAVVELALAVVALAIAGRAWRRQRGDGLPRWLIAVDGFGPLHSAVIAIALSAANPKNVLLTIGAATAIAAAGLSTAGQVVALAVFVAAGTLGVAAPVMLYIALGERSGRVLRVLRDWLAVHSRVLVTAVMALIAVKLLADGLRDL